MPLIKTAKGWKFGRTGKVYRTKKEALRQGRAIKADQARRRKHGSK